MVPAIVADLCRQYSDDVVNAELVKTMVVHAMKELFGQVIHCLSRARDCISGIVLHVINALLKGHSLL